MTLYQVALLQRETRRGKGQRSHGDGDKEGEK